jgi:uncharacterized protein YjbJ (UPF0337 family)
MSFKDRALNRVQTAKGKGKEAIGSVVGNKDLEEQGKVDQAKAGLKKAGEDVKDTVEHVKGSIKRR